MTSFLKQHPTLLALEMVFIIGYYVTVLIGGLKAFLPFYILLTLFSVSIVGPSFMGLILIILTLFFPFIIIFTVNYFVNKFDKSRSGDSDSEYEKWVDSGEKI